MVNTICQLLKRYFLKFDDELLSILTEILLALCRVAALEVFEPGVGGRGDGATVFL